MATKKGSPSSSKADQTVEERQQINAKLVKEVRNLLKPLPLDVIGHIESVASCCRNGTVALVKIEGDAVRAFKRSQRKEG
jgi:hypothetical protein